MKRTGSIVNICGEVFPIALLLLFFIPTAVSGQTQKKLTLQDVFRLVKEKNLQLQQAAVRVRQARNRWDIQKKSRLPTLALVGSYNFVSELARLEVPMQIPGVTFPTIVAGVNNQYDVSFVVNQPLFTGFRLQNQVAAAEARWRSSEWQKQQAQNQLMLQAGMLFYSLQQNLIQQKVLEQSLARAEAQIKRVKSLFQAAQAIELDTLEVSTRKLELRTQLHNLQNLQRILHSKLSFLLQTDRLPAIQLDSTQQTVTNLDPLPNYWQLALQNRPELKQLQWTEKSQQFQRRVARSAYFPQVSAAASYHYARPGVNFFRDEWMDYYTVGVSFQWQLWNWKKSQRLTQQAALELKVLALQRQEQEKRIRQEVEEAYLNLVNLSGQLRLQEELVEKERLRYKSMVHRFEQGFATSLDVSDVERALTMAELTEQKLRISYLQDRLQLFYVTGLIGKIEAMEEK